MRTARDNTMGDFDRRWLFVLGAAPGLLGGCSSSTQAPAPQPISLIGEFYANSAGATSEISFTDATHYLLLKAGCTTGMQCVEGGTYVLNAAQDTLTLTNGDTGQSTEMPFAAIATAPAGTSGQSLRALNSPLTGDGGSSLTGDGGASLVRTGYSLLTFKLLGQLFDADGAALQNPVVPDPGGPKCHYPIVLESGFAATASTWQIGGVATDLTAAGHALVVANENQPFGSIADRVAALESTVAAAAKQCATVPGCDSSGVHLIGHSQGGLDAREYLRLHPPANAAADHLPPVVSLTTISTPNIGTPVADFILGLLQSGGVFTEGAGSAVASLLGYGVEATDVQNNPNVQAELHDISSANAPSFGSSHPAVAGVSYFAWAGFSVNPGVSLHPEHVTGAFPSACDGKVFAYQDSAGVHDYPNSVVLIPTAFVIGSDSPNDSTVPIESAKALPGATFMGCIPADHLAELGYTTDAQRSWSHFDHKAFYRSIAAQLAQLETH
jgi:triacylglycerol esterase/lipase EstA (alpha/beta hydrolase family)